MSNTIINCNNEQESNTSNVTLQCQDSIDLEAANLKNHSSQEASWGVLLSLAFQSIGVIYGDIGTSPLYTFASTFSNGIKDTDDILGVLSLIYYTITLLPLIKYVFIVLRANDNGKGGTFALYTLLCRHAKVGLLPGQQIKDQHMSNYNLQLSRSKLGLSLRLKAFLENNTISKYILLLVTMFSTSLVIGDGVLTPSISVLSAVEGLKKASPFFTEGNVVWISVVILITLFSAQRFGTNKVGSSFAPILSIWFLLNTGIGVYNFFRYDPTVIKALNPWNIIQYFSRNGKDAWLSLGGVVLCVTGTEALFADIGHFSVTSVQISMSFIVYPAILATYSGQASFLRMHQDRVNNAFFDAIPDPMYWPMFVIAIVAAIIASQAMISGTFSIIQQSLDLGCFPCVKVIHTSTKFHGQVYIPQVNFLLMLASVFVTIGFRTTENIGHAYGIAVVLAETITSFFMVLVMLVIWKTHITLVMLFVCCIMLMEFAYLSSVLYKFLHGGYFPIVFASILLLVMLIWNYVFRKEYCYEMENKVTLETLWENLNQANLRRIPGLTVFYSECSHGIPLIFEHYAKNIPAIHSVLVFTTVKSLPVSTIPLEERFLFLRMHPEDLNVFQCVVRYGYTDARNEEEPFEKILIEKLKEFVRDNFEVHRRIAESEGLKEIEVATLEDEIQEIDKAWHAGVVHMIGEAEVVASQGSSICKRIVIDVAFKFLQRNLRQTRDMFDIPRKRWIKVAMTYEL